MCWQLTASEKPLINGYFSWLLDFRHQFVFCNSEQHTRVTHTGACGWFNSCTLKEGTFTSSPPPVPSAPDLFLNSTQNSCIPFTNLHYCSDMNFLG